MSTLRSFIKSMIYEGKVQDLEKKYVREKQETFKNSGKIGKHVFEFLTNADPSPTKKYLEWMIKQYISYASNPESRLTFGIAFKNDLKSTIDYFHNNIQKFENKDIYSYKTLNELEDKVKEIESKNKQNIKGGKTKKLFENEDVLLVRIDDKDASMKYGSGTKWCITMKNANYYEEYSEENSVLFYFLINKKADVKEDNWAKIAITIYRDEHNNLTEVEYYDVQDNRHDKSDVIIENFGRDINVDAPSSENVQRLTKSLLQKAFDDVKTAPKTFKQRLKLGTASDDEILNWWKRMLDAKMSEAQKTMKICRLLYKQQKLIATIDEYIAGFINDGCWFAIDEYNEFEIKDINSDFYFTRDDDDSIFIPMKTITLNARSGAIFAIEAYDGSGVTDTIYIDRDKIQQLSDDDFKTRVLKNQTFPYTGLTGIDYHQTKHIAEPVHPARK